MNRLFVENRDELALSQNTRGSQESTEDIHLQRTLSMIQPRIRLPTVSGTFYPEDPSALSAMIKTLLQLVTPEDLAPKAIIAPHAGYVYSGPIAASGYATLKNRDNLVERVILIGPSHRVGFDGLALSSADFYSTPLGDVSIDRGAMDLILQLPFVEVRDEAHRHEHSLEVQLPFLQEILGSFQLVPIVAGKASARQVAEVLNLLWGGPETLIVISSDLSHYHDYAAARKMDTATSEAIESLNWKKLDEDAACGRIPISGLLYAARIRGMRGITLDQRNSGDTAGSRNRVVGYGTYLFFEKE